MARAAFVVRSGEETRQMQVVCLDDLVAADDDLRRIEALVDWGQVRRTAQPFYRPGGAGRPGLDPAVLVKLALAKLVLLQPGLVNLAFAKPGLLEANVPVAPLGSTIV